MNTMLLMMGGTGSRYGADRPKQYTLIDGRPLFLYIVDKVEDMDCIDHLVIVSHGDWVDYVEEWCEEYISKIPYDVVEGGSNRSESVLNGLTKLAEYCEKDDVVLIHDATHPYVDEKGTQLVIDAVNEYGGATLASKNYDTVYEQNNDEFLKKVLKREHVVAGASPEAFRFGDIYDIYKNATTKELSKMTSAGAIALAHNIPMKVIPANYLNLKITYPEDMKLFLKLYDTYFFDTMEMLFKGKLKTLKAFDKMCRDNEIEYFAYGDLLVGCIHYKRSVPGQAEDEWRVGLVREQYKKLLQTLKAKGKEYGILSNAKFLGKNSDVLEIYQVQKKENAGNNEIFSICAYPFDVIPEKADERKVYTKSIRRRNAVAKRVFVAKNGEPMSYMLRIPLSRVPSQKLFFNTTTTAMKYHSKDNSDMLAAMVGATSKPISKAQLYPLTDRPFADMMLSTPHDYTPWTVKMTDELKRQIKTIQKIDLLIIKEFDRVCREIGVGYFICGGTQLGYMRHGGFIPWDDDMDVGMLRADYDKFMKEAPKYLDSSRFFLQTRATDSQIPYLFSKIRMHNTEYITKYNEHRNFHKGICLDLFPFDVIPNNKAEREVFLSEVNKKVKLHNFICNHQIPEPVYNGMAKTAADAYARAKGKLSRKLIKKFSLAKTQEDYLAVATKYNDRELTPETTVASFVPTYTHVKIKDLLPYKDVDFEGVKVMLMHHPDIFLEMQYGDYTKSPPVHMQLGHGLINWSADIPEMEEITAEVEKEIAQEQEADYSQLTNLDEFDTKYTKIDHN